MRARGNSRNSSGTRTRTRELRRKIARRVAKKRVVRFRAFDGETVEEGGTNHNRLETTSGSGARTETAIDDNRRVSAASFIVYPYVSYVSVIP